MLVELELYRFYFETGRGGTTLAYLSTCLLRPVPRTRVGVVRRVGHLSWWSMTLGLESQYEVWIG